MSATPRDPVNVAIASIFAAILLLGGAGAAYPALEIATTLLSIALLAIVLERFGIGSFRQLSWVEATLLLLLVALPVAQLIPLPTQLWSDLPGHALPAAVLSAAGLHPATMPLSLTPRETLASFFAMLPGFALFAAGRALPDKVRTLLAKVVLAVALSSACLGAAQIVIGEAAYPFDTTHLGLGIGIFVNRNHQAALLLIAICLASAFRPDAKEAGRFALWLGMIALLAAGILGTTSRTALVLLPLSLLLCARRNDGKGKASIPTLAAATVALLALAWSLGAWDRSFARFGGEPELRIEFWRTTWTAIQHYWPLGSGLGSFPAVHPLFEAREQLVPFTVNNAHNDYLELLLEGGAVAAIGLLLFFGWLTKQLWTIQRATGAQKRMSRTPNLKPAALASLMVLLAFSIVDYPMRMASLMAAFGLCCGILGPTARQGIDGAGSARSPLRSVAIAGLALLISAGIFRYPDAVTASDDPLASARSALEQGRVADARKAARAALLRSPTDAATVTLLALAERSEGQSDQQGLLSVASRLGWRDAPTQTWLFSRAADRGNFEAALLRLDALLRTNQLDAPFAKLIRRASGQSGFSEALAEILAANPPWRRAWLTRLADVDAASLEAQTALLQRLAAAQAPPTNEEIAALVVRSRELGDGLNATAAWSLAQRKGQANLLPDPEFRDIDRSPNARNGLLGWHRTDLEGLSVSQASPGDPASFVYDGAIAGPVLYQDLWLAPGRYRLTWRIAGESGSADPRVSFSILCENAALGVAQPQGAGTALGFDIPQICAHQRLQLIGNGAVLEGVPSEFRIVNLGMFRG